MHFLSKRRCFLHPVVRTWGILDESQSSRNIEVESRPEHFQRALLAIQSYSTLESRLE